MALQRVLVGSPVCERASVLRAFLISLKSLEHEGFLIDYILLMTMTARFRKSS